MNMKKPFLIVSGKQNLLMIVAWILGRKKNHYQVRVLVHPIEFNSNLVHLCQTKNTL